jgi:hypothetical protein
VTGETNLLNATVNLGDRVQALHRLHDIYRMNTNDRFTIEPDEVMQVTRVYRENLVVRTIGVKMVRSSQYPHNMVGKQVSFSIDRMNLRFEDPNYVPPPPPRKLGVMPSPEDVKLPEGIPLINIEHPGIQWLFDDMGRFAEEQGYCSQYDALCIKLGIPGRPREFKVHTNVAGIDLVANVRARSQREANEQVKAAIDGRALSDPDEEEPEPALDTERW